YVVRAVANDDRESFDSNMVTSTPNPRTAGAAYVVPVGLAAAGTYGGSLGMDFDVARPIRITQLGVYDDQADGLHLPLTAALFDRDTKRLIAAINFTPDDPGTLRDSSRFKPLHQPITLPAGFRGVIAAWGYGPDERYFSNWQDLPELTVFSGGSLLFVGSGRYGEAGRYPEVPDAGPVNRYAAGTFYFEPVAERPRLSIDLQLDKVVITWIGTGKLQESTDVNGPWSDIPGATSGSQIQVVGHRKFFRVVQ
ncbi:MAG: hypothetical protein N3G20_08360, partial [Verrucomicrobiae bacterium]|nr:hypothetical protein [Verrucomicrobiae bacterium]